MVIENDYTNNAADPDYQTRLKKIRAWQQTYTKWGRDTLGFGIYLFRNGNMPEAGS